MTGEICKTLQISRGQWMRYESCEKGLGDMELPVHAVPLLHEVKQSHLKFVFLALLGTLHFWSERVCLILDETKSASAHACRFVVAIIVSLH
jgi:hypothetical protein